MCVCVYVHAICVVYDVMCDVMIVCYIYV